MRLNNATRHAPDFLCAARQHMHDRSQTYDAPGGERSMGATVQAFNAITGHRLTEEQGWLFMETLKMVRSQQGSYRADNYEDAVAYAALRGEAAEKGGAPNTSLAVPEPPPPPDLQAPKPKVPQETRGHQVE